MPPNVSVASPSISRRVPRMLRQIGRIRLIQVRWVTQTSGSTARPSASSRQSMKASTTSEPHSCTTAFHGL